MATKKSQLKLTLLTLVFCIGIQLQEGFPYRVVVQESSNELKEKKAKKVARPEVNPVTLE